MSELFSSSASIQKCFSPSQKDMCCLVIQDISLITLWPTISFKLFSFSDRLIEPLCIGVELVSSV